MGRIKVEKHTARLVYRVTCLWLTVALLATSGAAAAMVPPGAAAPGGVALQAAGRGNPWVNLLDGRALSANYSGAAGARSSPRALAAADLDGDGAPDLVSGYAGAAGGALTVHLGNRELLRAETRQASQTQFQSAFIEGAFSASAGAFDQPASPDLVGAGDFDADGRQDIVSAARGSDTLYWSRGDGAGGLGPARAIRLPGAVSALTTGDVNRRDGLEDVVVAIVTPGGAQALVFESPSGALSTGSVPEVFDLPAPATALAIGQLDADYAFDLAAAAGRDLLVVSGRDRQLTLPSAQRASVPPAVVRRHSLPFDIISLALGNFVWEEQAALEIALLTPDGAIHVLDRSGAPRWQSTPEGNEGATQLLRAKVSSLLTDDLVVLDQANRQIHVLTADGRRMFPDGSQSVVVEGVLATLDVGGAPVAALPLRLNTDALSDLVILAQGAGAPLVALTAPNAVFTVNSIDAGYDDANIGDGECLARPPYDEPYCGLRAAIQEANATPGADSIQFALQPASGQLAPVIVPRGGAPLPPVTEAVTIDGGQNMFADQVELSGGGLAYNTYGFLIEGGHTAIRRFVINRYRDYGIWVKTNGSNVFDNDVIGTSVDGHTRQGIGGGALSNSGMGIFLTSGDNEVRDSVIAGNYDAGIGISPGTGNELYGNRIGVSSAGVAMGNDGAGIFAGGVDNTVIGGTASGQENVIVNNEGAGIRINQSQGALIANNRVGVNEAGTAPFGNAQAGILVELGSSGNTIGGVLAAQRNIISGNLYGVVLQGDQTHHNLVQGNTIGASSSGLYKLPNTLDGVLIKDGAYYNSVGGTAAGAGNLISGNGASGVCMDGSGYTTEQNSVLGNLIGTIQSGNAKLGNTGSGVLIRTKTESTHVGGIDSGSRNIISGNGGDGVTIEGAGATGNVVGGNIIGLDKNGAAALGNGGNGVAIGNGADNNTVGQGLAPNIISANTGAGVFIGSKNNQVGANYIGANLAGSLGFGNSRGINLSYGGDNNLVEGNLIVSNLHGGVSVHGADNTLRGNTIRYNGGPGIETDSSGLVVGGSTSAERNVISNNTGAGIRVKNAGPASIHGNYIGTDPTGLSDGGNGGAGVELDNGYNITIGGASEGQANLISGNTGGGLRLVGGAHHVTIQGNSIGLGAEGGALGNSTHGVYIADVSSDNTIVSNTIAYNTWAGVFVSSGTNNKVVSNTIYANQALGIDLSPYGATLNDTGDGDAGPNDRQNFPVLASVAVSVATTIQGALNSHPNTSYTLQFFASPTCDTLGYGEGQTWLATADVSTDGDGNAGFSLTLPGKAALGKFVSATATDPNGNTSEFSQCALGMASSGPPIEVNRTDDTPDSNPGDGACDSSAEAGLQCTLRAALQTANAIPGANTVILPPGAYVITRTGAGEAGGDLDIGGSLSLVGAGANTSVISMTGATVLERVLHVYGAGSVVSISGVTIQGGYCLDTSGGGGIYNAQSALTLDGVTLRDNWSGYSGGGILTTGPLTVTRSAIVSNTAFSGNGGGLYQRSPVTTRIANTTISANQAAGNGGGIANVSGTVSLNNVTVVYNTADTDDSGDDGGGLYYASGVTFTVGNSIVAQNVDTSHESFPYGQADCAGTFGSAGYNLIGDSANKIGCLGFASASHDAVGGYWAGPLGYLRYTPGISPLADNGGTTPSHALFSPYYGWAIDQANPAAPGSGGGACEPFDQRGQPRPVDGNSDDVPRCDMGSFEYIPVTLDIGDASVVEGGAAVFTVTLAQPAAVTTTVKYSTTAGTATPGADYITATGKLTFTIGADTQIITVTAPDDAMDEDDEVFYVTLYRPSFVQLGKEQGVGTITDNDGLPTLSIGDAQVAEGDTFSVTYALFTVTLSAPSGSSISVDYASGDETATGYTDYAPTSGQLTFAPGATSASITLTILGDDLDESDETFTVTLSHALQAVLADGTAVGTIADNDTAAFSIEDASIDEGDAGTTSLYFDVRLSKPSVQTTTVAYATADGTAQAGSDYAAASGVLSFPAGDTVRTIAVAVYGDEDIEPDETFSVTLSSPTGGAIIADGAGVGTIADDDGWRYIYLPLVLR